MKRFKPVIIADDDPDDQELMKNAFQEEINPEKLHIVNNGRELLDYLDSVVPDSELPGLIVLDLNMPVMDGWETLETLKAQARYRQIPVVMYTTSENAAHKRRCLALGAADYIPKPYRLTEIKLAAKMLLSFVGEPAG